MQKMQNEYSNVFTLISCFKGTFSLQVKNDTKPYHAFPKHIIYAVQRSFKKELESLHEHMLLASLWVEKKQQNDATVFHNA